MGDRVRCDWRGRGSDYGGIVTKLPDNTPSTASRRRKKKKPGFTIEYVGGDFATHVSLGRLRRAVPRAPLNEQLTAIDAALSAVPHAAANIAAAHLLLEAGATVTWKTVQCAACLKLIDEQSAVAALLSRLLEGPPLPLPEVRCRVTDRTALMCAASVGNPQAVAVLMGDGGAEVDATERFESRTALLLAADGPYLSTMVALAKVHRAAARATDARGASAADRVEHLRSISAAWEETLDDIEHAPIPGEVRQAVADGDCLELERRLSAGADPEDLDPERHLRYYPSALHDAVAFGRHECASLLLAAGARVRPQILATAYVDADRRMLRILAI